jgi:hypothetical protein
MKPGSKTMINAPKTGKKALTHLNI